MSRRARAVAFAAAAALCAGLAAAASGGGGSGIESQLGPLRPALVASESLPAGRTLSSRVLARSFELRRVPERFLPPGALSSPEPATGRRTLTAVPAGGYLLSSALRTAGGAAPEAGRSRPLAPEGRAVEIAVTGAAALAASGRPGRPVDVVVTSEPGPGGGGGRTYVAAEAVPLLDLRSAAESDLSALPGAPGSWLATLSVSREQALRLIQAESFARSVRLIASN